MKKLLFKIATVAAAAALSVGTLASCGLFTVNQDRDMKQVVATVQIADDVALENIYKREMVAGYVSYGYQYVQYYGQTSSQAYATVLNNLINNKVIIQQSKKELVKNYKDLLPTVAENDAALEGGLKDYLFVLATDAELEKYDGQSVADLNAKLSADYKGKEVEINSAPFRFVKPEKVYEAISGAIDSVNSLIDSVADDDDGDEVVFENISYTARTTPTMNKEEEEETEDDIAEKIAEYKKNYIKLGGSGAANFAKAFDRLVETGVLDSTEDYSAKDVNSILSLSYFRNMIKSSIEGNIVNLYEEGLKKTANIDYVSETDSAKKDEIFNALWDQYANLQKTQQASYQGSIKNFETKLGSVNDSTFVVYDSGIGYTYVTHLVVNFDEQQTELVSEEQKKENATDETVQAFVDELAKDITVKDLRATWVQSGYGTYDGEKFTFSDDYVYDTEGPLANYLGKIDRITTYVDKDEDDKDELHLQFHGVTPDELNYDRFVEIAKYALGGDNAVLEFGRVGKIDGYDDAKRISKEDFNKFEDLKFAFSNDEGNFNNYLGYLFSPITSSTKYVSAYFDACKEVSEAGVGAYKMFASKEYGLHIVLCSAKATYGVYEISEEGKAEFRKDLDDENKDSVAYLFMQANVDLVTDNYISDVAQGFIYSYTAEDSKQLAVKRFENVYKDLVTE